MNWTKFVFILTIVYSLYYLLNILFDLFKSRGNLSLSESVHELVFSEAEQPKQVDIDEVVDDKSQIMDSEPSSRRVISSGPLQSTGGVSIKQLFSLAQSDLIEYTKAIPY